MTSDRLVFLAELTILTGIGRDCIVDVLIIIVVDNISGSFSCWRWHTAGTGNTHLSWGNGLETHLTDDSICRPLNPFKDSDFRLNNSRTAHAQLVH